MILTAKMTQLIAVVLDHDGEAVTRELLRQSVLHFVGTQELSRDWTSRVAEVTPRISVAMVAETRKRIEAILSLAQLTPPLQNDLDVNNLRPVDIEESNKTLDAIGAELQGVRERQKAIQQEILKLEDIRRQVSLFGDISEGMRAGSPYSYLKIRTGSLSGVQLDPPDPLRYFAGTSHEQEAPVGAPLERFVSDLGALHGARLAALDRVDDRFPASHP